MTREAELIDRTLQGDSTAFGQLVRRHQDRLFTSMVHLIGQREEAEDIVQDALLQALRKLPTFRRSSSFYTWLYRIAINVAMQRRRRARSEVSIEQPRLGIAANPIDPSEPPHANLIRAERAAQLHKALHALSDEFRTILVLREIDGFDYESIAHVLEISVGTVRSRLYRARMQLRQQLEREHDHTPP